MKYYFLLGIAIVLISCSEHSTNKSSFTFPPEWDKHESIWLGWTPRTERNETNEFLLDVAKVLTEHVKINIVVQNDSVEAHVRQQANDMSISADSITFFQHHESYFWMRDPGPFFLKNKDGDLAIAHFKWIGYSGKKNDTTDVSRDSIPKIKNLNGYGDYFAKLLGIKVVNESKTYAEGGAIEVNGAGTMMAVEEMVLERNPSKTLAEIEADYLKTFGKTNMLWLKRSIVSDLYTDGPNAGNYLGGGANGHIDEFCRFVNDSTVLLGIVPNSEKNAISIADGKALEENYEYIQKQSQPNGKPWNIIRMPMPNLDLLSKEVIVTEDSEDLEYYERKGFSVGDTVKLFPSSSYLNFLITNGVVLAPKYWREGLPLSLKESDELAAAILKKAFPNRSIIQLDAIKVNRFGGGIHCMTQQQPK